MLCKPHVTLGICSLYVITMGTVLQENTGKLESIRKDEMKEV